MKGIKGPGWLKGLKIGLLIGISLFLINVVSMGILGIYFIFPLLYIYHSLTGANLESSLTGCFGEPCWGPLILMAGLNLFILSISLGLFIGLYGKLKGFIVGLIIIVVLLLLVLLPLGMLDYNKNMVKVYDSVEENKKILQELNSNLISISQQPPKSEINNSFIEINKAEATNFRACEVNSFMIDETTEKAFILCEGKFIKKYLGNKKEIREEGISIYKTRGGIVFTKDFSDKFNLAFNEELIIDPITGSFTHVNIIEKNESIIGCFKLINEGADSNGKIKIGIEKIVTNTGYC